MNAAKNTGFSDVTSVVAVDSHVPTAGSIIWWRLSGNVDYDALKQAWVEAGLAESLLPSPCSAAVALRRAAHDLKQKRRLVRPLGRGEGFAIVKEQVVKDNHELEHQVLLKVQLDAVGRPQFEHFVSTDEAAAGYRLSDEIRASFERHLSQLETEDFSSWFVRMMPVFDAVSLRDTGGVYFVPFKATKRLETIVGVLAKVTSHTVNRVPAMRSEEAVAAILDAVTQEAEYEAGRMEKAIEEMKLGERGFENRIQQCDEVESKVTRYEELLGCKLDDVRARLEKLRSNLTLAVMKARSGAEA